MNNWIPHIKITATITRKHFRAGRKEPMKCPVALALQAAGCQDADVRRHGRLWTASWRGWVTRLPVAARKVSVAFDAGRMPDLPVTFTIDTRKDWRAYYGG